MMTKNNREEILNDIYNLILNPATSAWERSLLSSAKNAIGEDMNFERQLSKLEFELRPLAVRNNLTADVTDFYMKITGNSPDHLQFDFSKHYAKDLSYQDRAIFAGGCSGVWSSPLKTSVELFQYCPVIPEAMLIIQHMNKW
ncbi:hypothetical protein ATX88_09485 [Oenococcus oeni]|nr:hypothetical protein ATX88_09485 [Oenococcus oeni]